MTSIRILVGSVYGGALLTARELKRSLEAEGHHLIVLENPELEDLTSNEDPVLICTSTTGEGEVPPNLLPFYVNLRDQLPQQPGRPFGVIVLGDSSYGDTFCGAGDLMEEAFLETGARDRRSGNHGPGAGGTALGKRVDQRSVSRPAGGSPVN